MGCSDKCNGSAYDVGKDDSMLAGLQEQKHTKGAASERPCSCP